MGLIGFATYAAGLAAAGRLDIAASHAALAAACAGFLAFNLPPARLFMGDVGAIGLGFLAGLSGLQGILAGAWPWWFPPLVFAPFIFDATATLLRRVLRGENPARAHRDHYYQRAILIDGSHRKTLFAYGAWMAGCAALALGGLAWAADRGAPLLLVAALGFGGYCRRIDRRWALRPEAAS
jgi:UDP-N-acetylmuramyl pentapeptide phosphotransferase/UDP-N-acetylglucosamine-1-phosphate transferase